LSAGLSSVVAALAFAVAIFFFELEGICGIVIQVVSAALLPTHYRMLAADNKSDFTRGTWKNQQPCTGR
jgi:hypothetical protein